MKKLLIGIGAVFAVLLVLIVAVVVISSLGKTDTPVQPTGKIDSQSSASDSAADRRAIWQEQYYPASHIYNANFYAGGSRGSLIVKEASFFGVENKFSNLVVSLVAESSPNGEVPSWFSKGNTKRNFSLIVREGGNPQPITGYPLKQKTSSISAGSINFVIKNTRPILSEYLSPVPRPGSGSRDAFERPQLFLRIDGFYSGKEDNAALMIGVTAPPPPPGLFFGQEDPQVSKSNNSKANKVNKAKAKKQKAKAKAKNKAKKKKRGKN